MSRRPGTFHVGLSGEPLCHQSPHVSVLYLAVPVWLFAADAVSSISAQTPVPSIGKPSGDDCAVTSLRASRSAATAGRSSLRKFTIGNIETLTQNTSMTPTTSFRCVTAVINGEPREANEMAH